ncbi:MAG: Oxygen-insensitive NAD(P)H nitroreductase [Candidatus Celerinatantimonas neptuna]|nr:MAG: Oxygen-insensitive NAD(P)H nitroreductase [Candidatus Celerinatantimonas neptuna]
MNPTQLARARYTAKAFDPSRKIPLEQFDDLIESLRLMPSSVNSQPWHFIIASDESGKQRIAKSASGVSAYNAAKIINASHVVVFCTKTTIDETHLELLLGQEQFDGRFNSDDAKDAASKVRQGYVNLHKKDLNDLQQWMEKQTYLALGGFLVNTALLQIDATPMEGVDFSILDKEFELASRNLRSTVVVALGYHSCDDFNASLPKSRLTGEQIFDFL